VSGPPTLNQKNHEEVKSSPAVKVWLVELPLAAEAKHHQAALIPHELPRLVHCPLPPSSTVPQTLLWHRLVADLAAV